LNAAVARDDQGDLTLQPSVFNAAVLRKMEVRVTRLLGEERKDLRSVTADLEDGQH
jgi:hypothetical protein